MAAGTANSSNFCFRVRGQVRWWRRAVVGRRRSNKMGGFQPSGTVRSFCRRVAESCQRGKLFFSLYIFRITWWTCEHLLGRTLPNVKSLGLYRCGGAFFCFVTVGWTRKKCLPSDFVEVVLVVVVRPEAKWTKFQKMLLGGNGDVVVCRWSALRLFSWSYLHP